MKELLNNKLLLFIILLVLCVAFYWFQLRPSTIKSNCNSQALDQARNMTKVRAQMRPQDLDTVKAAENNLFQTSDYNSYYDRCLQEKGL